MPEKKPQPQQSHTYAAETSATLQLVPAPTQETPQPPVVAKPLSQQEQQALVDKLIHFLNKF
jgi:hypothetical protein